jgi:putative transposase
MTNRRRRISSQFKFKVALEAIKGLKTINQIASENNVHPNQVSLWKKQLIEEGPNVFDNPQSRKKREQEVREVELYEQIGRLKMELEWLKKSCPFQLRLSEL